MSGKRHTVVDRRKWLRGPYANSDFGSCLLRGSDGMRCCLGFALAQRGFSDDDLLDVGEPIDVAGGNVGWMTTWVGECWETVDDTYLAMEVNDGDKDDDESREAIITEIFERNGETIEFVGPRLPKVNGKEVRYEDAEEAQS